MTQPMQTLPTSIQVRRILDEPSLQSLRDFRGSHMNMLESERNDFLQLESIRDHSGLVFAFEKQNQLIGTVRLLPTGEGLTFMENLFPRESLDFLEDYNNTWEIGRLVLAPDQRGMSILSDCLQGLSNWLWENSPVDQIFAVAEPALVRLYRKFAFGPTGLKQDSAGKKKRSYNVITSALSDVLKSFGTNPQPRDIELVFGHDMASETGSSQFHGHISPMS